MKALLFFIICFCVPSILYAIQCIYPVGSYDNIILIVHQESPTHLKLWSWNTQTGDTQKLLGGHFMPLSVQILPDKSGFSFIDNGRIRIKYFKDRSIKSINLCNKSLSNINLLHWIDSRRCFFSARYKNWFQIFQMTIDGYATLVAGQKYADYLYPQKVDNDLFYIERTKNQGHYKYRIMQTKYDQLSARKKVLLNFNQIPIMFLYMMSNSLGYVLEYPSDIPDQDKNINFTCHRLERKGEFWGQKRLFSFAIPLRLIEGQQQLVESLLPLLPNYHLNYIDFVHYHDAALNIFRLHYHDPGFIEQLTFGQNGQDFFAPRTLNSNTFYGKLVAYPLRKIALDRIMGE